ncbi:MAG: NAD(+)/NADH kinase [Fibromonadaceae bacterium]|jgi:NAD+ kinase|nr:NAD(+)/NADH kinase [Fibromonadaceae bacterium]
MNIGIVSRKEENPKLLEALEAIRLWAKGKNCKIIFSPEKRLNECDVLVAVGGDGTVLSAAHLAYGKNIPIAGINAGRVGFLAEYGIEDIPDILNTLASGKFSVQSRIMLDCTVYAKKKKILSRTVLNEIYLHAHAPEKMVNLEVKLNSNHLTEYWADSLMLATPTGSTAYNLAAGGPIIYPSAEAFVLNAVNPMSLSVRPIIIPSSSVCKIKCVQGSTAEMVFDGHFTETLDENEELKICCSRFATKFACAGDLGFVRALREKLGWTGKMKINI